MTKHDNRNKGFSLIELIIAIAILAIVLVPVLNAFVTSAKIDGKSKTELQATTAAQNIMEQIRGADFDDLLATSGSSLGTEGPDEVVEVHPDNEYKLIYHDVKVSKATYEVEALVSAYAYSDGLDAADDYNKSEHTLIYGLDRKYDGLYVCNDDLDTVAAEIAAKSSLADVTSIKNNLERYITIDVTSSTGLPEDTKAQLTISYKYSTYEIIKENKTDMYIPKDDASLRAIYLFFSPMGNALDKSSPKEHVTINHTGLLPMTVYLVGQKAATETSFGEYYSMDVSVKESDSYTGTGVYTTVRTNLKQEDRSTPEVDGEIQITYEGSDYIKKTGEEAETMVGLKELADGVINSKMYKVEVVVRDNDGEELVKIEGTKEK